MLRRSRRCPCGRPGRQNVPFPWLDLAPDVALPAWPIPRRQPTPNVSRVQPSCLVVPQALVEGNGVEAVAGAGAQLVADGGRQAHFGIVETAERAHRAEPVAPLRALDGDQARLDLAGDGPGAGGELLLGEAGAPVAPDRFDVARRRRGVGPAVERIDPLVVTEADLGEHLPGAGRLRAHLADGILDLLREQRGVDLAGREQLLDEFLVLPGEPIRFLVGEPGELAPQRLPERAAPVLLQLGERLDQHPVAEAGAWQPNEEERDVAELLAGLLRPSAIARIHHQPADLGRAVEVVADREHAVPEVPVHAGAVVLLLVHVEEDVRRVAGAVLRDDQRGTHHPFRTRLLEHEDVLALEGILHPPVERPGRPVDDAQELPLVVGQVHGVQLASQLLQGRQIAPLDVADHVHAVPDPSAARCELSSAQSSRRICSYTSTARSSCAISMRSFGVCAFPVDRPGPITTAWHPRRAKTPASVLVGLARGDGSSPARDRTRPIEETSSAPPWSDIPPAFRITWTRRDSSPPPRLRTHSCAFSSNPRRKASGSCSGKRRASKVACADARPYTSPAAASPSDSSTLRPPTPPGGSKRASSRGASSASRPSHKSSRAPAVIAARQRLGCGADAGRKRTSSGAGAPDSRGAGTSSTQLAGTTLAEVPPAAERSGVPEERAQASARRMAFSPSAGVELCAAFPAKTSRSTPGPALETTRAFESVTVQRTTAYPLCAVISFSSLGSPHSTKRGWISP